ncbi:MAG: acyltransferase domain-containing protein, partial [Actinobacteria bacterium]|nr:acyltransferase domain-containing protein [Actinomycetota bacterium]
MTDAFEDRRQHVLADSLREIRRLRAELQEIQAAKSAPVAIVGMACRMPGGAEDPESFWEFVRGGGDAMREVPAGRFAGSRVPDGTWKGGFLQDIETFDAAFFGISPREAATMDPQQRLLLEVGWEALEDAGIAAERLAGTQTGVFLGVTNLDYNTRQLQEVNAEELEAHFVTSGAAPFAAGRLSYWLGLAGPSLTVDTACSSSLVGLHLGCQSLRAGDCDTALVGGVNVMLSPESFVVLAKTRALSPDGACKTFDARANGYARGEGCAIVVLKRLKDAQAAGDRILAVIKGSAVNQDGRSSGITVPNPLAQQAVVRQALTSAGVTAAEVDYVEAHGTGTPLGDPIELRALGAVYGTPERQRPLAVGSVKTNIGHLEPAAGVAGLMKVVLALGHEEIPPHQGLGEINPEIGIEDLDIVIPVKATPWSRGERTRIAGVSSFGASGTNAHVIVAEPPAEETSEDQPEQQPAERVPHILTLSAKTPASLASLAGRYAARVAAASEPEIPDICFTANTGRTAFPHRAAVVGGTPDELAARLTAIADGRTPLPGTVTGHARSGQRHDVVFLFTGQGSQYPGMGRTLRRSEPVFATAMDHCEQILTPLLGRPLREVLDPSPGDEGLIHQTRWTQPALFAIEYALAELWRSRGITPAAVMGHSVGELVAACVAGAIDLADGLLLAVRRGELMQELCEPGAMAAVFASPERVEPVLAHYAGRLALAAVNGPQSIVVSGDTSAVDESLAELAAQGVKAKRLASGLAFHSPLVEPMLSAFEEAAAAVRFAKPRIPLISNVTGQPLAEEELSARYLREHAREPVRFSDGMTWLYQNGYRTFVEIGPAPTLLGMARRFTPDADAVFLPALRPQHDDRTVLLEGLARLFVLGHRIDWASDAGRRHRVALPTYSFQRERHWYQAKPRSQQPQLALPSASQDETSVPWPGDLLGRRLSSPLPVVQYQARLDAQAQPCLGDCVLDGLTIVNIGVYLEAAFRAVRELEGGGPYVVDECLILQSLVLTDRGANDTQLHLEPGAPEGMPFRYYANHPAEDGADDWRLHARGRIHRDTPAPDMGTGHSVIEERGKALPNEMSGADFYRRMWRRKLYLGPQARWIESLRYSQTEAVARMRLPEPGETDGFLLHPGLTDSMFQLMFACIEQSYGSRDVFALVSVDRLVFHEYDTDVPLLGRVELTSEPGSATITADFRFEDELGRPVLLALGTVARKAERGSVLRTARATSQESGIAPARQAVPHAVTPSAAGNTVTSRAMGDDPEILVTARVAAALRLDPADLDRREPLQNLGMDSLMALEVRDALTADLGTSLPLTAFLDGASITTLADLLGRQTGQPASAPEPVRESGTAAEEAVLPATRHVGLPELRHDADARYEPFPMTDLQQAYWVGRSDAFALGGISTYFYTEVDLCGLDLDRLEDSLQLMIARHDMLRAVARPDGTQQVLAEVPRYVISRTDLSGVAAEERERRLAETHSEMSNQVLDATVWPAWEVRATLLGAGNVRLHVGIDALMADAWSTSLLFREWADAYADGATSKPELPVTYRDYVLAQRAMEGTEVFQRSLDYWRGRIETLPPAPDLPLARAPESIGRPEFGHRSARLSQDEWARFKQHAAAAGVTASAALCAAYSQVLAAWRRSSRFTLNVLFFNRMPLHPAVGGIVGNFTATTMLEVDSTMTDSFAARAQRSQRQLWSDMEHSHVSGVRVLRELSRARGGAVVTMPVVFASTVDFGVKENASTSGFAQHLTTMAESGREVWSSIRTPQVWLDHQAVEDNGSIVVNWDVIQGLFPAGMIDAMFEAYVGVLRGLCQDDQAWHLPVPMLVPAAQLTARAERNATESPLPDGLLHSGFAAQAARCPDRIAVIGTDRVLSYRELDAEANRVHHWLSDHGVGPGSLVGIVMEKGWQQVVAAVGILKAGAAYVPLDAALPAERLHLILASADMTVALTQRHLTERIEWPLELSVLEIDGLEAALLDEQPLPAPPCTPEDLAYVIFTSGSTGVPKGVMIEHSAAVNTVTDINERFGVTADDRILALSALNFDLSVYDIFGLLAVGGAVVLPTSGMSREPAEWARLVIEHRITIWNTVPTLMEMFTEHCLAVGATEKLPCPLRLVMMSGDWIPVTLPDRIRNFLP